jgi:hypothetical protein
MRVLKGNPKTSPKRKRGFLSFDIPSLALRAGVPSAKMQRKNPPSC